MNANAKGRERLPKDTKKKQTKKFAYQFVPKQNGVKQKQQQQ